MDEASTSPQEKALAEEGLRRGVLTQETVRDCLRVRDEVRKLGVDADLGSILVQKNHITQEQLRALTAFRPAANCFRHPDRPGVSHCARCGRPLCADCVIRIGTTTLCGETCAGPEAPRLKNDAHEELAAAKRRKVKFTVACVTGIGVLLTLSLWLLSRRAAARADRKAFSDLVARREYGHVGGEEMRLLEGIIARRPGLTEAHVYLAETYRRAGEARKGVALLTAVLKRRPAHRDLLLKLAECYQALNEFGAARRELGKLLQSTPDDAEAARALALLLAKRFPHEAEEVEKAARASLAIQPEDRALRYHLAKSLRSRGMNEAAAKEMEAVLSTPKPGLGDLTKREAAVVAGRMGAGIHLLAARLRLDEGKPSAAAPFLEEALRRDASNAEAGKLLAELHLESGRVDEARTLLSRLVGRAPSDPRVWEAMAEIDLSRGDLKAYERNLSKVYGLRPDDTDLAMKLVGARMDVGDREGAALLLKELGPGGGERATELRARLALDEGKLREARSLFDQLGEAGPREPSGVLMLARLERASGGLGKAVELLGELVASGRGGPGLLATARMQLGLVLWQKGDAEAAASEFECVAADAPGERDRATARKLLKLAQGLVPDEAAVSSLSGLISGCAKPEQAPAGAKGLLDLALAKARLFGAVFGDGGESPAPAPAPAPGVAHVPGIRKTRYTGRPSLANWERQVVGAELTSARLLFTSLGVRPLDAFEEAEKLASGAGASPQAMRAALDAQLAAICELLKKEGMAPASESLRRKAAALAAVQETALVAASATAYVLAEALASVFAASEVAWAYEPAAWKIVRSAYAADGLCSDGLSRLCNAERAHVLLLNMLALEERDVQILTGSGAEGKR